MRAQTGATHAGECANGFVVVVVCPSIMPCATGGQQPLQAGCWQAASTCDVITTSSEANRCRLANVHLANWPGDQRRLWPMDWSACELVAGEPAVHRRRRFLRQLAGVRTWTSAHGLQPTHLPARPNGTPDWRVGCQLVSGSIHRGGPEASRSPTACHLRCWVIWVAAGEPANELAAGELAPGEPAGRSGCSGRPRVSWLPARRRLAAGESTTHSGCCGWQPTSWLPVSRRAVSRRPAGIELVAGKPVAAGGRRPMSWLLASQVPAANEPAASEPAANELAAGEPASWWLVSRRAGGR